MRRNHGKAFQMVVRTEAHSEALGVHHPTRAMGADLVPNVLAGTIVCPRPLTHGPCVAFFAFDPIQHHQAKMTCCCLESYTEAGAA